MIAVRLATQKLRDFKTLDDLAVSVRCRRGDLVSGPGHSRQYWFKIVSGAAKRFSIHSDGRRQIVDLLLSGDFVGIGRDADLEFTVEAVTDGTVLARYSRHLPLVRLSGLRPQSCRGAFLSSTHSVAMRVPHRRRLSLEQEVIADVRMKQVERETLEKLSERKKKVI